MHHNQPQPPLRHHLKQMHHNQPQLQPQLQPQPPLKHQFKHQCILRCSAKATQTVTTKIPLTVTCSMCAPTMARSMNAVRPEQPSIQISSIVTTSPTFLVAVRCYQNGQMLQTEHVLLCSVYIYTLLCVSFVQFFYAFQIKFSCTVF
jgi:hypothetical protein